MSNQLQITGDLKVKSLTGALTASSGVVASVALGGANGVATLDSGGKIPVSQLPNSVMEYKGSWDASTNTPTLADGTGNAGDVYICSVAGIVNFGSGPITFAVGDQVIYNGTIWQKIGGGAGSITGSGTSGEIAYFNGTSTITSEAAFVYDASTNRLGVNTSVPNATIGANSALDSGYGLLIKTGSSNYNGIGVSIDSTYGNLISTEKLGSAIARNLTLLNQSGFVSLKENGNFGVNTLNPAVSGTGIDIYGSTSVGLRFHTATSGTTVSDGAGINYSAANNLGITNYENGAIDLVTNGSSGVYIANTGFVGINGATPTTALTVNGSATISGLTTGQIVFPTSGGLLNGSSNLFWNNSTSQLGVGTNVPSAGVTCYSTSAATQFKAAGTAPAFTFSDTLTASTYAAVFGLATGTNQFVTGTIAGDMAVANQSTVAGSIIFGTGSTQKMKLTAAGDLGIGASSPDTKLDVRGEISLSYSADNGLRFYNQDRSNWSSISNINTTTNANLVFRTSSGTALTLNNNRDAYFTTNVSIGSGAAPSTRLQVVSTGTIVTLGEQSGTTGKQLLIGVDATTGTSELQSVWQNNSYTRLNLNPNGGPVYAGAVRLDTLSDERIKDNIQPITGALDKVLSITGKKFHLKDEEDGKIRYGFIAQELEGIVDELVIQTDMTFTKDDLEVENIKSVDNWASSWSALLVEAIKEQQAQIEELKEIIKNK